MNLSNNLFAHKVADPGPDAVTLLAISRERGFYAHGEFQDRTLRINLPYLRALEDDISPNWDHVRYTRAEVDQAEAVITWQGELSKSFARMTASDKITRLANETITMHRGKRAKVQKDDGTIPSRASIARMGKAELRTDATKREQVLDLLISHRHLIPVARKGHYLMTVPHS